MLSEDLAADCPLSTSAITFTIPKVVILGHDLCFHDRLVDGALGCSRNLMMSPREKSGLAKKTTLIPQKNIEGNFGGNQLLDSSISLSPLYSSLTNDLHVRIATSFHQDFPWLHPTQA